MQLTRSVGLKRVRLAAVLLRIYTQFVQFVRLSILRRMRGHETNSIRVGGYSVYVQCHVWIYLLCKRLLLPVHARDCGL